MGNMCNSKKEVRLILIGLDLAGKTSVLHRLRFDEFSSTNPTVGFNFETIFYKNLKISIWDTGGQDKIRDLWKHYYEDVDGILYVVDSTDELRIEEAKEALHKALRNENLRSAFLCILANKRDLEDRCMSLEQIQTQMQLSALADHRSWTLLEISALKGTGFDTLLQWVSKQRRRKS